MVTLEMFKTYLRNSDADDNELQMFLDAAKEYAKQADVPEYENNKSYDLLIYSLAITDYNTRGFIASGVSDVAQLTEKQNSLILSLRKPTTDEAVNP